jgi:hypothetical protein
MRQRRGRDGPARRAKRFPRACHIAAMRSKKLSGERVSRRPSTSLICSVAITVAMPAVKPVVTGCGMNSMNCPSRPSPIPIRISPPMIPEISSPAMPKRA